jgi:hypothetical protein
MQAIVEFEDREHFDQAADHELALVHDPDPDRMMVIFMQVESVAKLVDERVAVTFENDGVFKVGGEGTDNPGADIIQVDRQNRDRR